MYDVVVLSLEEGCGTRTPVLSLRDALTAAGARVRSVVAGSDKEIDEVLDGLDDSRLVVASAADGQLRAVVRRLVRRHAPAPRERPDTLPADRTVPDLPPLAVLPIDPATGLVGALGLPVTPQAVADAVLGGSVRRLDLLRTDSGSVTLDGALLGATDDAGRVTRWQARVEVDDVILSDGTDPLLACVVANAGTYSTVDGLPLVPDPDPADGVVRVAVAIPVVRRSLLGKDKVRVEVRRAKGRAVSVNPSTEVPLLDDGVAATLDRRRSWWIERGAWAVYAG